ncbi:unnamed protein product, partial [Rotaria magnacalcarata]
INSPFIRYSEDPDKFIRVLEQAVISTIPHIRYRPGWQSSLFFYPLSILPCWLVDKMFSLGFNACPDGGKHQLLSEYISNHVSPYWFIIIIYVSYRLYQHFNPTPNISPNGKYILISGCDTGFGHGSAIELDKQGFNELSSRATVLRLDITKQEDIDTAFELVKEKTQVLHGLVNNAGISISGYVDWMSKESLHKVMDVNFFGHVAMTKKFLPLLIAKRDSRVVNICSAAGYIATPAMSAYSASKYALESAFGLFSSRNGSMGFTC